MHKNRSNVGTFWGVPRKGTKYLARSPHNEQDSIPLIVVARDILKFVRNRKELKKSLNEKLTFINNKEIRDTSYPVCLFDVISFPVLKKQYRAVLNDKGKMVFEEINEKDSLKKVYKIIGKKMLKGNKIQVNLLHGENIVLKDKVETDDSIVLNFKDNKVEKIIKMDKGSNAYVVKGKHIGKTGKIEGVIERGNKKLVVIRADNENKINVWIKNVIGVE